MEPMSDNSKWVVVRGCDCGARKVVFAGGEPDMIVETGQESGDE